jgi:hypothetical protein
VARTPAPARPSRQAARRRPRRRHDRDRVNGSQDCAPLVAHSWHKRPKMRSRSQAERATLRQCKARRLQASRAVHRRSLPAPHQLEKLGVTGSNPVSPTQERPGSSGLLEAAMVFYEGLGFAVRRHDAGYGYAEGRVCAFTCAPAPSSRRSRTTPRCTSRQPRWIACTRSGAHVACCPFRAASDPS